MGLSDEVVPGPSVFHSREPGVSGNFRGRIKGATSGRNMGLPWRRCSGQGPHPVKTLEPHLFSRVVSLALQADALPSEPPGSLESESQSVISDSLQPHGL